MAGDEHGDGVGAAGAAHGADGFGIADGLRDFAVAFGFARGEGEHHAPDGLLKFRGARPIERRQIFRFAPGEHGFQRLRGGAMPAEDLRRCLGVGREDATAAFGWEIQTGQAFSGIVGEKNAVAGGNGQFNQGCFHINYDYRCFK